MSGPGASRRRSPLGAILVATVVVATVLSRVGAADRLTWWLEASWVLAGLPIAVWVATRRGITPLLQVLLAAHALVLLAGAHWTYERVPLGDWARDALGLAADAFLGSQGDPWDAQWDMLCCLVGAIASMLAFAGASGIHERQLERLKARDPAP